MLALGEFNYANFSNEPQAVLCYMLFLFATFFCQITMLNMLIAIMGDSFERVIENRDVNATKIKLNFMSDAAGSVGKRSRSQEERVFIFIAKPEQSDALAEDQWEGTINKVTSTMQRDIAALSKTNFQTNC